MKAAKLFRITVVMVVWLGAADSIYSTVVDFDAFSKLKSFVGRVNQFGQTAYVRNSEQRWLQLSFSIALTLLAILVTIWAVFGPRLGKRNR